MKKWRYYKNSDLFYFDFDYLKDDVQEIDKDGYMEIVVDCPCDKAKARLYTSINELKVIIKAWENRKGENKVEMNLKEAMLEIIWVVEAWGRKMNGLNDKEKEALKVVNAHCQPYIKTIDAMQGLKCLNTTLKMEKGDN